MSDTASNAYTIMGVPKGTSDKDLKTAYVNLVKKYDPEKHTDRFMVIQRAFDKLKNPKSRAQEDVYTYNTVRGDYLFNPDEKAPDDQPPSDSQIIEAEMEYKKDPMDAPTRGQFVRLLFMRAHAALRRKQLSDSIRDWSQVLEMEPAHIRARHNLELACASLGHSYALHGLHEEAIELWERALTMNPDNTELIQNLALVSEKAGEPARAGRYWAETMNRWKIRLSGEPDNEYLRHCIVEALNHHGEYVEANPMAAPGRAATAAPPTSRPVTHAPRAMGSSSSNATPPPADSSPQTSSSASIKIPGPTPSSDRVALPSIVAAPAPAAPAVSVGIDRYREILSLRPDDFDAHLQLCNKLMDEQLWDEAQKELMNLARKHPKNVEVLNMLGWALLNSGQKDMAFNAWKKSLSIDPSNPATREQIVRAHLSMGKAFRNKGLFTQALVHFKQLTVYMPNSAEVMLEIAATYDMKGDIRAAAQEYNRVLAIDPKNKVARKAITDLKMKR